MVEPVEVKFNGDISGLATAAQQAGQATEQIKIATEGLQAGVRELEGAFERLSSRMADTSRQLSTASSTLTEATAQTNAHAEATKKGGEEQEKAGTKFKDVATAFKDLGGASLSMGKEIRDGTNPLLAIVEQAPAVVGALAGFGPVGVAVSLGLTALGTAAYVVIGDFVELKQLSKDIAGHLTAVGLGATGSAEQVKAWINSLHDDFGLSQKDAAAVVDGIRSIGVASVEEKDKLQGYAGMLAGLAPALGGADKIAQALAGAFKGGADAILELDKSLNFLTVSDQQALRAAKQNNDLMAERAILMHALSQRYDALVQAEHDLAEAKREREALGSRYVGEGYDWGGVSQAQDQADAKVNTAEHRVDTLKHASGPDQKAKEDDERAAQAEQTRAAEKARVAAEEKAQADAASRARQAQEEAAAAERRRRDRQALTDQLASIRDGVAATREGMAEREQALAGELAFVQAHSADLPAEARRVQREITAAHKATLDAEIKDLQQSLAANIEYDGTLEYNKARLKALQTERYGEGSEELRNALKQDADLLAQAGLAQARDKDKQRKADQKEDVADNDLRRQMMNLSVMDMAAAKAKEVEAERDATLKILEEYRIRTEAAATSDEQRRVIHDRFLKEKDNLEKSSAAQIVQINRQAARDQHKEYQQTVSGITKSMGSMVQGLITGTKTVRQSVSEMANKVLSELVDMAEQQATAWIMSNVIKLNSDQDTANKAMAQSVETATSQIKNAAATGAANAYASASAGPAWWVAPAISAAVQLAISGLTSSLSSAAGGWGRVPADGMLTELHKDEMVLPAGIASPLRTMLAAQRLPSLAVPALAAANFNLPGGGAANANAQVATSGDGGVTFNVQAMDSRDVASFFNRHGDKLVAALRGQKRNFAI
ncbi:phage tail length tape measure family protein [Nitrospirillum sp. BR 11164]|uniref:hypothetical protein n=1 Tax=Nitrospirillum sp. BR 11164 TaxID=3104324 RepID=UPI002AFE2613|nr:hypothetical protein [Nitrospirillum sp. BR 11164]MEA1651839.1 phage tail length tape measure family protein [Nitrospirillum sp. BR 11164]